MFNKLPLLLIIISLVACNQPKQDLTKTPIPNTIEKESISESETTTDTVTDAASDSHEADCQDYWSRIYPDHTTKAKYIDSIILNNTLSENNIKFLEALKNQTQEVYEFESVLSPIFRLSNTELGIFTFPKYKQEGNIYVPVSKEMELIQAFDSITNNSVEHFASLKFYPELLDSIFKNTPKPYTNYYTINNTGSTQIQELGIYVDECLEYFEYAIDTTSISKDDKILFSSPFAIDLVYETNKTIDSLIAHDHHEACGDCPNSIKLQKTYAKLKGSNNVYFTYADTFPLNDQLDTPSRALVYLNNDNKIVHLWYAEIDLFGCSCL